MKHILIVMLLTNSNWISNELNKRFDLHKRAYEHCKRDNMEVVASQGKR